METKGKSDFVPPLITLAPPAAPPPPVPRKSNARNSASTTKDRQRQGSNVMNISTSTTSADVMKHQKISNDPARTPVVDVTSKKSRTKSESVQTNKSLHTQTKSKSTTKLQMGTGNRTFSNLIKPKNIATVISHSNSIPNRIPPQNKVQPQVQQTVGTQTPHIISHIDNPKINNLVTKLEGENQHQQVLQKERRNQGKKSSANSANLTKPNNYKNSTSLKRKKFKDANQNPREKKFFGSASTSGSRSVSPSGSSVTGSVSSNNSSQDLSLTESEAEAEVYERILMYDPEAIKRRSTFGSNLDEVLVKIIAEKSKLESEAIEGMIFGPENQDMDSSPQKIHRHFNPCYCLAFDGIFSLKIWCKWLGLVHISVTIFFLGLKLFMDVAVSTQHVHDRIDDVLYALLGLNGLSGIVLFIGACLAIECMTLLQAGLGSISALLSFCVGIYIMAVTPVDESELLALSIFLVIYSGFIVYVVICSIGLFTQLRAGIYFNYVDDYKKRNSLNGSSSKAQFTESVASSYYLQSDNI